MFLLLHNKGSVDNNTLHVQSGITISKDSGFSEGEAIRDTSGALICM